MTHTEPAPTAPSLAVLGGALLAAALVLFAPQVLNDGDTYWHLAAGRWMIAHGQVLKTDVFSYTRAGAPWDAHEWLSEGLMAVAFRLGGWSGLLLLFAAGAAATAWIVIAWLQQRLSGVTLLAVVVLSACCLAPGLLARPHMLALPMLAAWSTGLLTARERHRAPPLAYAALIAVWANLHGSYVFGFVLLGAFALEALLEAEAGDRWRTTRDWSLFGGLCLVAALLTPQGLDGLIYPFKIMGMKTLNAIQEWQPADFSKLQDFEIALLATLFVCLGRGVRVPPVRLLLLLFLLYMALQHARQQLILAVVAPLLLADPLALALAQQRTTKIADPRFWPAALELGCAMAILRVSLPIQRINGVTSPVAALEHVPAALASQPVLNDYGFGGYLIFQGVKPFIDGRADMYGDAYFSDYIKATRPDATALKAMLDRYKVAWTVFSTADPVVKALDAQPGWKRLYGDKTAVVHVRDDALPQVQAALAAPVLRR